VHLAKAVHERWPSIKIIVVSGKLNPSSSDLPPCSKFFGKPLDQANASPDAEHDRLGLTTAAFTSNAGNTV
jgi:hypothetical protein